MANKPKTDLSGTKPPQADTYPTPKYTGPRKP